MLTWFRKADKYRKQYKELREALDEVFWSNIDGVWFDYDLEEQRLRRHFYASNVFPLLLGGYSSRRTQKVHQYLLRSGVLDFKGY